MQAEFKTAEEVETFVISLSKEEKYIIDIRPMSDHFVVEWQEQKFYTAVDGATFPDEVWFTEDGRMLQIQDIPLEHCRNIIRMIIRQDREMEQVRAAFKDALDILTAEIRENLEQAADPSLIPGSDKPILH